MAANEPQERELTEEEMIAAMEQALAIKPPAVEPTASTGSGSSSSLFHLGLIVAVVFPIAWGLSSARGQRGDSGRQCCRSCRLEIRRIGRRGNEASSTAVRRGSTHG